MKPRPFLLDVSVLLALTFPEHQHHARAQKWFRREGAPSGFRTCPFTECGFVRIASNPAFTDPTISVREALALLDRIKALPEYGFWPDDLAANSALPASTAAVVRHRHVTDDYLLALANQHGGRLATFDRGIAGLPGATDRTVTLVG